MQINDRVYGKIDVKEKVIADLINSKLFQRLKKVHQDGSAHMVRYSGDVTRYEHSIGVWYLSSRYRRTVEEQIACLLHDLSHTAFSHVIDFVVKDRKHEFADKILEKFIRDKEIAGIIESNGFDIDKVLNKSLFPLLDNNLPDISFDRWDYFMRDGFCAGYLPQGLVNMFLEGIKEENDVLYFEDVNLASTFAILFVSFSRLIWLDPDSHGSFFVLAKAIETALDQGAISQDDFFSDDETLKAKLIKTKIPQIKDYLARLKMGAKFVYAPEAEAEFFGPNKPRFVDPWVKVDGKLKRLATLVPSLDYYYEEFAKNYKYLGVKQIR